MVSAAVLSAGYPTGASAATPGWGPDAIPYRAGIVCTGSSGSSALVSWSSAATDAPAYALTPVTADAADTHVARPAVDTATATPLAGRDAATLAALLARHGRARDTATAAEVAAAVLARGGSDPVTARCLATGRTAPARPAQTRCGPRPRDLPARTPSTPRLPRRS